MYKGKLYDGKRKAALLNTYVASIKLCATKGGGGLAGKGTVLRPREAREEGDRFSRQSRCAWSLSYAAWGENDQGLRARGSPQCYQRDRY